jgi:hypothetical protein
MIHAWMDGCRVNVWTDDCMTIRPGGWASGVIQGALCYLVTSFYHLVFPPTAKEFITSDPCTVDTSVYTVEPTLFYEARGGSANCFTGSILLYILNAEFGLISEASL